MNFEDDLRTQFSSYSLCKIDGSYCNSHLYCDFIELLSLITPADCLVTSNDVLARVYPDIFQDDNAGADFCTEEIGDRTCENNDRKQQMIESYFEELSNRSNLLGELYPFQIEDCEIQLKSNLSIKQKDYLGLLVCSNLNNFKKLQPYLTSDFEEFSYCALKNYLPPQANVKKFGEGSSYSGSARDKIIALAADMNIEVNDFELNNLSPHNSQEKGLDIVAWLHFYDKIPNMVSILGQCACGKKWYSKIYEPKRYVNYFKFYRQSPILALFVPYFLVNQTCFHQSDDIVPDCLIFDRVRILTLIGDCDSIANTRSIVENCIEFNEEIV